MLQVREKVDHKVPHACCVVALWHGHRQQIRTPSFPLPCAMLLLLPPQVLEKLDEEGCACVATLLKGLPYSSVFVVGQANSFVTKEFASVDTVVKAGGCSSVEIGAALF
jgi:hypothetical protein